MTRDLQPPPADSAPLRLLAVGGAHVDRRARIAGVYVPAVSNPGQVFEEAGGGVFNAACTAHRRRIEVSLSSLRGGDMAGDMVARAVAEAGLTDLSAVFLDRATPSYTALVDRDGELIAGLADMTLYDFAFAKQMSRSKLRLAAAAADAVLCDANLPEAALERLVKAAAGKPVHAMAISPAKATRLSSVLSGLATLFMSHREAASLAGALGLPGVETARRLRRQGLAAGVISAGAAAVIFFDRETIFRIEPPAARRVSDATGAGDALAGATVAALMRGGELKAAIREGLAAALLTVESGSASHDFTAAEFTAALAQVGEAEEVE